MNTKNKNILLGVLIVGVLSMTVAFAALSTRLNINGTTNVAATKWNIHFQEWAKVSIPTVNGHQNTAEYPAADSLTKQDNNNVTKVTGINVVLNQPGDTAKYTFQIINEGTIDAKLSAFTPTITGDSNNALSYTVVCKDSHSNNEPTGNTFGVGNVLRVNAITYCSLEVKYKDVTNTQVAGENQVYHQDAINASISAAWTWTQDDGVVSYSYQTPAGTTSAQPQSGFYLRTSSAFETDLCGVFPNGTVCMTNSTTGYSSNFSNVSTTINNITTAQALQATGLEGYAKEKAEEMLSAGATSCSVYSSSVNCNGSGMYCDITSNGSVTCDASDYSHRCSIYGSSSTICF